MSSAASAIYQFSVKDIAGRLRSLAEFQGSVLVIVNTASQCGFTPQYAELQSLYERFHSQGFEVLGFPCNQFLSQEPGSEKDIEAFVKEKYGVTFPMFSKLNVNGSETDPLFAFLKHNTSAFLVEGVKWNFTKFLISRSGIPVNRYSPTTTPLSMVADIEKELAKEAPLTVNGDTKEEGKDL